MSARTTRGARDERGVALVMAIVVLLVISLLATAVMQNLSTQRKISGHGLRTSRALSAAEAGVSEVVSRMRSGEIVLDESRAGAAAQIFLLAGGLPTVGVDTTAYGTLQPAGNWLEYSATAPGPDVLTLGFRRDDAGRIVRWDDGQSPALNTTCGLPVYRVTSTGKVSGDRTRIQSDFLWKPLHLHLDAALCTAGDAHLDGDFAICGYQHEGGTAFGEGVNGRTGTQSCTSREVGIGNLPGVWACGVLTNQGVQVAGIPAPAIEGQAGFYAGPWEPLGLTTAELLALLGSHTTSPANYRGCVWLDDDGTFGNGDQVFEIAGLSGDGLLYVDGDLTLTGEVAYRGLIYVEGNLTSTATGSVVGGVIVKGRAEGGCDFTNGPSVIYSRDAIGTAIGRASREIVTLSWREVR